MRYYEEMAKELFTSVEELMDKSMKASQGSVFDMLRNTDPENIALAVQGVKLYDQAKDFVLEQMKFMEKLNEKMERLERNQQEILEILARSKDIEGA